METQQCLPSVLLMKDGRRQQCNKYWSNCQGSKAMRSRLLTVVSLHMSRPTIWNTVMFLYKFTSDFKLIWSFSTDLYESHHFDKTLPWGVALITCGQPADRYDEICALLGYYTAWIGKPTFRNYLSAPSSRSKKSGCPETSVRNYHSTLRHIQEERRSHFHNGGSLKWRRDEAVNSRIAPKMSVKTQNPQLRTWQLSELYNWRMRSEMYQDCVRPIWQGYDSAF
jgi:hypothetical protein